MTRRANCPECSATLALGDDQLGQSIRCSNCRRVFKISAFRPKNWADDERPTSEGKGRQSPAEGDGRDEAEGPRATPGMKQTAHLENQPRHQRQAGGVPVGMIAAAAKAAAMLGLAAGGGFVYLYSKPVASPVVVEVPPAHSNAAPDGVTQQNEPDPPVVAQGHDLERVPEGLAREEQPDPPLLAKRQDLEGMPDGPAPQKQPDPQPPHPGDGHIQQDAAAVAPPAQQQRWRYVVVTLPVDSHRATEQLNSLADLGWEYVGLISTSLPPASIWNNENQQYTTVSSGQASSILLRRPKILFKVPGAIEGERLKITAKSSSFAVVPESMTSWAFGQWSGDRQLNGHSSNAGDWTDLALPAPAEGNYHIVVYLTRSPTYGVIQFYVNGTKLAKPIDCFHADTVVNTGAIDLGTANLKKGVNSLGVEVVGTNPKSTPLRYAWGLDCVVLKPAK
jgi:hypothetical protein